MMMKTLEDLGNIVVFQSIANVLLPTFIFDLDALFGLLDFIRRVSGWLHHQKSPAFGQFILLYS